MAREKKKRTPTFTVLLIMNFMPSVCQGVVITQTPRLLLKTPGSSAEMKCHQNDESYIDMFWYQQKPGEGLKLMIYSPEANKIQKMENVFESGWELERNDIQNSVLRLKSAEIQDSAVYFCASRYHRIKTQGNSWHKSSPCRESLSHAVTVTQDKPFIWLTNGTTMDELSCKHDATTRHNMLWYQQKPGEGLVLIAVSVTENDADVEKAFKETWTMTRPSSAKSTLRRNGTVNIHDSAMYYCAASDTALGS
ncbi:uncharacterized protein LOC134574711 [Pelobates fuscus]|uniref:uncharacterized protein LOC134574711 n=1 Tax=Pelobates fuscus TaxID=191477 RepID=UPI002FE447C3